MSRAVATSCGARTVRLGMGQAGSTSAEFALVLPVFLMAVMAVLGLAVYYFSLHLTATAVPLAARSAGVHHSPATGRDVAGRIMRVSELAGSASGALHLGRWPECERAMIARLRSGPRLAVPLLPAIRVPLSAASVARDWEFWAGPPRDGCE